MKTSLKLLLLEDDPLDAELNIAALESDGFQCEWERVQTKKEFLAALDEPDYDLILIDYNLPSFDGMSALHLLRGYQLDVPAILVSGNLGEELAIDSIKAGAVDYVHKDRIGRLSPSVKRALNEKKLNRREKAQSQNLTLFRKLNQAANSGFSIAELIEIVAIETSSHAGYLGATVFLLSEDQEYFEMQSLALPAGMRQKLEELLALSIPSVRIKADNQLVMREVLENKKTRNLDTEEEIEQFTLGFVQAAAPSKFSIPLKKLSNLIVKLLSFKGTFLLPLYTGDSKIGVLAFPYKKNIDPHDIHRMEFIAEQLTEILARKLAEEKVKKLHREQSLILDSVGEGIFGLDEEGRHSFVNPTVAVLLGYAPEEMLGKRSHTLFHHTKADGSPCLEEECPIYRTFSQGENVYQSRTVFWRKDGSSFPALYSSTAIEEEGKRIGAVITFQDISKQVESTREIARLAEVVKQASITIAITNLDGDLVYVNPFFEESSGYSATEALGANPRVLKSGLQDSSFYKKLWATIAAGETWRDVFINKRKDGSFYYEDANIFPIKTEDGEIINYAAVKRDITAQMEADKALKEERDFSERIISTSNAIIVGLDKEHIIRLFNKGAEKVTGYKKDDVLGEDWFSLVFRPEIASEMNKVWDDSWGAVSHAYVNPIWTKEGEKRIISWQSTGLYEDVDKEKQLLLSIGEDITERKKAEDKIKVQLSHLDALHIIDSAILASTDLSSMLDVVLMQAKKELAIDAADLLVFNPASQSLECAARVGFKTDALAYTQLRLRKGLAGQAALQRTRFYVEDLREDPQLLSESPELLSEKFIAYFGVPLITKGKVKGVLEIFHRAPLNQDIEWLSFLDTLAGQAAIAIENISLFEGLQKSNMDLRLAYDTTLEGWAHALELRDMETEGHSRRVTTQTTELATAMGVDKNQIVHIRRGALLHDIGKMGISDAVLRKRGAFTDDERREMQQHPVYAYAMLKKIIFLKPALDIPYSHHEKWDGTGYPLGMRGLAIPLAARIFSVVDVYDALTNDRRYRKAWSQEKALTYLRDESGTYFDPDVVDAFIKMIVEENGE